MATATLRFQDGTESRQPIAYGRSLMRWNSPQALIDIPMLWNARRVWKGTNGAGETIGLYDYTWRNEHPEKKVLSVTFEALGERAAYILLAITGEAAGN